MHIRMNICCILLYLLSSSSRRASQFSFLFASFSRRRRREQVALFRLRETSQNTSNDCGKKQRKTSNRSQEKNCEISRSGAGKNRKIRPLVANREIRPSVTGKYPIIKPVGHGEKNLKFSVENVVNLVSLLKHKPLNSPIVRGSSSEI